jgi:NAD-dependent deacetylase
MAAKLAELQSMVDASNRIVFFGGAGVSTESGIPDFRSADGLYNGRHQIPPETILSRGFFEEHPKDFFDFCRANVFHPEAKPNPAHRKLAELEQAGRLTAVITQNIDGLHQAAGSTNVLELHGSYHRNYCANCGQTVKLDQVQATQGVPRCSCGGIVQPDVVLYGDPLDGLVLRAAVDAIRQADLLIVGGTSLTVYPAAGLLGYFRAERLVVINRDPGVFPGQGAFVITARLAEVLGQVIVRPGGHV